MRPLYIAVLLVLVLVFATAVAISGEQSRVLPRFGVVCERMLDMPFGANIHTIEKALGLDETRRQSRQQTNYKGIIFSYLRDDGLVVDVGVNWIEPNKDVPNGKYAYQGHHTIVWKGKVWHRWSFEDGKKFNYFGIADTGIDGAKTSQPFNVADFENSRRYIQASDLVRYTSRRFEGE